MDMMTMGSNLPAWVTPVAWAFLILALLSAVAIAFDISAGGHPQRSRAMSVVWPVAALYLGPVALFAYRRWGRTRPGTADNALSATARPSTSTLSMGLPGGAASVLAHLVGVPLVVLTGWTIAGLEMWAMVAVIAVLALVILFAFEYASRAGVGARVITGDRAGTAALVAVATIVAFDIGMVGWMVLLHIGELMPPATDIAFTFLMQVGVVIGLATAYPVITQLTRRFGLTAGHAPAPS